LVNRREVRSRAVVLLRELQFDLDPDRMVGLMPRAEQQMVEIAKDFAASRRSSSSTSQPRR
jgi:ABC-type sugar transport system ATPase subunit